MELWKGRKWGKEGGEEGSRVRPGLWSKDLGITGNPEMWTRRRNGFLGDAVASWDIMGMGVQEEVSSRKPRASE